jgi:hypothetical protein
MSDSERLRTQFKHSLSDKLGGNGTDGRKQTRRLPVPPEDLAKIQDICDDRPDLMQVDLIRDCLATPHMGFPSLLRRIERGEYSPPKLIAAAGQSVRGTRAEDNERDRYQVGLPGWKEVEEAAEAVTRDLRLWLEISSRRGAVLPGPLHRCSWATVIRAAARETAEERAFFSEDVFCWARELERLKSEE